jgi:hypothetical protein
MSRERAYCPVRPITSPLSASLMAPPMMLPIMPPMTPPGVSGGGAAACPRPGDALRLPKTFYKDGRIATRRSKTGQPVYWPTPTPLRTILKDAPSHDAITLCANSDGKPWTVSGFRASWRKCRQTLERDNPASIPGSRSTVSAIASRSSCANAASMNAPSRMHSDSRPSRWRATMRRAPISRGRWKGSPRSSDAR